ncbi:MAG: ornithine carbamoyltransferase [Candidatus Omnitrophica bacterium]|nr:ornithine carbamoyltransferase [Candidatus Omnitrophota bacterium]
MIRHFISLKYFSSDEIWKLVALAADIKKNPETYEDLLKYKTVGLIFEKPSLRTKTAFFVGTEQLGGSAIYYGPDEIRLGQREKTSDVAQTLSCFLDAIVLRTFAHNNILELAQSASIPVINALSDFLHPSQVLADILTIKEKKNDIKKLKVVYLGDGNNVCNSLIYCFSILGGNLVIATPKRYRPQKEILEEVKLYCRISGATITITESAQEAAQDADVLYTDVWTSMGKEKERTRRRRIFRHYQINEKILSYAKRDCMVLHCLPAHRGEEITDSVIDGKNSFVFTQAENRLYAAKAILVYVLKSVPNTPVTGNKEEKQK